MTQRFNAASSMRVFASNPEVRPAAVAGLFYPGDAGQLEATLATLLGGPTPEGRAPKALIVPHAGYVYSGATAGRAYRSMASAAAAITRVVLLGPSHREWFAGLAVPQARAFATPLGLAWIDEAAVARAAGLPSVILSDAPHAREHSLEVQVPFLQRLLPNAQIVPVLVGEATAAEVESVIDALWGGPETLIVVSSDLSHYHGYDEAKALDAATAAAILEARSDLTGADACGGVAVNGLLRAVDGAACAPGCSTCATPATRPVTATASSATALSASTMLEQADRRRLLELAQQSTARGLGRVRPEPLPDGPWSVALCEPRATFTTLTLGGALRGCRGAIEPHRPLVEDVWHNAWASAYDDPRFPPVSADEVPRLCNLDQRAVAARGDCGGQRGAADRGAGAGRRRPRARARRRARDVPARRLADAAGPARLRGAAEVQGRLVGVVLVAGPACLSVSHRDVPGSLRASRPGARRRLAAPAARRRCPAAVGLCSAHDPTPGAPRRPKEIRKWRAARTIRRPPRPRPPACCTSSARTARRASTRSRRATWRAGERWSASG